ncbi:peroxide stress protein YaaA [Sphingorhabdus sp. SMR4y]|uniref:peroxide stress protein YaaA n=1 Tax=Sphingorhabdus sp. SMR4y TaxID=2584094 RepID=UPI000B5C417C|nr:peroxide stress protein YaaA [Sphingorhabdus sp. SMR4y]ASK87781.1 protein YaaA [Sphingorhabdus sp. SMR4y]
MLAIISPAKSLDFESAIPAMSPSENRFPEETERLANAIGNLTVKKLKAIMPVSDNLIALNRERYSAFFEQPERPAIYAYNGDVYTGFEVSSLEEDTINFAQDHLRILSGLYGLLRPLDPIRPHRLEMGTKWAPRYSKLTDFWKDKIATALAADMEQTGSDTIVNLASNEYWASVKPHVAKLPGRVIEVDFRKDSPDGPKFISFEAKRARGMMARYICENHLTDPEALKGFDYDGYRYDAESSTESSLRFLRT